MKKTMMMFLSALLISALFAGCSSKPAPTPSPAPTQSPAQTESPAPVETPEQSPDLAPSETPEQGESAVDAKLEAVLQAVKEAYGENYLPNMVMEADQLTATTNLNMEDVESVVAEVPMISMNIDTFIGVKAKEGKADSVEETLMKYQTYLREESMQYPMNMPKVQSSEVIRHGDYIFFLMLGAPNENMDATEEESLTYAQEQMKIGVDAVNAQFAQ